MEEKSDQKPEKVRFFPSGRFGMALLWFIGSVAFYLIRMNFGVSIVCMTLDPVDNVTLNGSVRSYNTDQCNEVAVEEGEQTGEFEWSRKMRGLLNSAFFIGYILTHIAGGVMALRLGSKWVIFGGMGVAVVSTLFFQLCAQASPWALFGMRIVFGMGCGVFVTSIRALQFNWAPTYERSIMYGMQAGGYSIGSVIAFAMSGALCDAYGWEWTFYVPAFVMTLWMILWGIFGSDYPEHSRFMSEKEADYIVKYRPKRTDEQMTIPWGRIFTSLPCLAIFFTDFCAGWSGYTILTSGAQYMKDVLKFDIKANGGFNAIPNLAQWIMTLVGAAIADTLRKKKLLTTTATRKLVQSFGMLVPACLLIGVGFLTCDRRGAAVAVISISHGFGGLSRIGIGTNMLEVAPRFTSIIGGITNCFSTAAGVVAPIAAALLTPNGREDEWRNVFFVASGINVFGWIIYMIFGKGEAQSWAKDSSADPVIDEVEIEKREEVFSMTGRNLSNGVIPAIQTYVPKTVEVWNGSYINQMTDDGGEKSVDDIEFSQRL